MPFEEQERVHLQRLAERSPGEAPSPTMAEADSSAQSSPDEKLVAQMVGLDLGSRSAARRLLGNLRHQGGDVHKCLTCGQYFDAFSDLRRHVKTKTHVKKKEHVKRLRLDFIQERLATEGITTIEQAQQMYEEEQPRAMTDAEKATWRGYAVQLAWLVQF